MIGLLGPAATVDELAAAAEGVEVARGSAADVVDAAPEAVVAVGERAVIDLVAESVACPILPVRAGPGLDSVDLDTAAGSLERIPAGEFSRLSRPVLAVSSGDDHVGRAVYDAMLVTSEPARISEFSIAAAAPIDRFRADGVVAATPAGSHGYAKAAGGPVVEAQSDVVTVVPVGAFTIRPGRWVVEPPVTIGIERDEGEISLLLDDRIRRTVPNDRPVEVSISGRVETIVLDG